MFFGSFVGLMKMLGLVLGFITGPSLANALAPLDYSSLSGGIFVYFEASIIRKFIVFLFFVSVLFLAYYNNQIANIDFVETLKMSSLFFSLLFGIGMGLGMGFLLGVYARRNDYVALTFARASPFNVSLLTLFLVVAATFLNLSFNALVVTASLVPVLIMVASGIVSVENVYILTAHKMGADAYDIVTRIILPAAAAFILIGVRIGVLMAFLSLVVFEARWNLFNPQMVLILSSILILIVGADFILSAISKVSLKWQEGVEI